MMNRHIYLDDPNVGENEKKHLNRCIDSTFISTHGPFVPEFETKFARVLGCEMAVSLQSGTAGLHIALYELGIGKGDEVILPALTFVATANAIKYVGAMPVFVDVEPITWNISASGVEEAITSKTKAIIVVHLYGNPCAMDEIMDIAKRHNLYVVEDACQSLTSKYEDSFTGTFGDFGVFSFNGNKVITTGGGGMVLGSNEERVEHIKFLVNQAREEEKGYYHPEVGFNFRMTNLEASLGLAQLERLAEFVKKKKRFYKIYDRVFQDVDVIRMQRSYPKAEPMWWFTSVAIDTRKVGLTISEIQSELKVRNIPTRRVFMPVVEFPQYSESHNNGHANAYNI